MENICYIDINDKIYFKLNFKIKTNAKKESITKSSTAPEIFISINKLPVKGEANTYIIKILSKEFNIAKSNIQILKGNTSKYKTIGIWKTSWTQDKLNTYITTLEIS